MCLFFLKVTPLVQVLMSSKSEALYVAVLRYIQRIVPRFRPSLVMTDFETALQNAWKEVFPRCTVHGCYWHYCRVIMSFCIFFVVCNLLRGEAWVKS